MLNNSKLKYLNPINLSKKILSILLHPKNKNIKNINIFLREIFNTSKIKKDIFYAIYDLEFYPNTFNFIEFLVLCNNESKKRENRNFFVLFIPRKNNSLNKNSHYNKIIDDDSYNWRLYNLLFPLVSCSNRCIGFNYFHSRELGYDFIKNKELFPTYYSKSFQQPLEVGDIYNDTNILKHASISPPSKSLSIVKNWLKYNKINKKYVTISIRDQKFDKVRNSKINQWILFADYLISKNYTPIIIPDTESELDIVSLFPNCVISYEASYNVLFRIALNQFAYTNLFVSHGPLSLCAFNRLSSYIIMHYGPKEGSITDNVKAYKEANDFYEGNYKFSLNNQIRSWKEDTLENIKNEFNKIIYDDK